MSRRSKKKRNNKFLSIVFCILLAYFIYYVQEEYIKLNKNKEVEHYDFENIPEYNGEAYIYINNNEPFFNEEDITVDNFEYYSNLDELGRCGVAYANISKYSMPTEDRESIGNIQPSGWQTIKYDIVSGKYLYNRCHLIGYQLTGENDNENNLITCTRYMNATTMLKFENEVASYVDETGNHVLYRVTPYFKDDNLVATGVMVEAYSVEDNGEGLKFNVFIYNVQPGIIIDYKTGDSKEEKSD
ncbi:MAG: DNA/RNA non-specific endonuclease [Bacilli bacterium]